MNSGIKVFAPATVANVGVGFDVLGFALHKPGDEVLVRFNDHLKGLHITKISGAEGKLPYAIEKNTAGFAAQKLLEHLGQSERGIEMEIHKKMPFGSGLGSSAASAVAGVFAVSELLKTNLSKRDLLPFAIQGEAIASGSLHADNVAPALLGGMVLVRDHHTMDVVRVPVPRGLYATLVYPNIQLLTSEARAILSKELSLKKHIEQNANFGGFLLGLFNSDFDLIKRSLHDVVIEPQRATLIPNFFQVKEAALANGALGCSISGAGPSMFALCDNSLHAENVGLAMQKAFANVKIPSEIFISTINQEGVIKL